MHLKSISRGVFVALALCAAGAAHAQSASRRPTAPAENRSAPLSADVPACADAFVLGRIASRFASRESWYWDSGLSISGFDHVADIGYRTNGIDYLPRRYCTARAVFEDGSTRKVAYAIASDLGWLGVLGFGVEWCVEGLDRNFAYGGACRAAGP